MYSTILQHYNIFRVAADIMHAASVVVLLRKLHQQKSCAGAMIASCAELTWGRHFAALAGAVCARVHLPLRRSAVR
jgi:hypothetical protein